MNQQTEKQTQLNQRRAELISSYPFIWDNIVSKWKLPDPDDRAWLMYSANYLFRTHGIRWAVDPLTLRCRLAKAPVMDVARDLKGLDFVLLTHEHKDHLDIKLLNELRHLPIYWVVPEAILPMVQEEVELSTKQVFVPKPLQPIKLMGFNITPFAGLHWEESGEYLAVRRGVPAMGYLVEKGEKRWFFPGDTRKYDPAGLPDFGPVDVLFAHLWLGRGRALNPDSKLVDDFCRFCLDLRPRRIILTHLEEWGRQAPDFWEIEHAEQVVSVIKKYAPILPVEIVRMGDEVSLADE